MSKWSGLARNKRPALTSPRVKERNGDWKGICLVRAEYLIEKYGYLICEYSGEAITTLSTVPNSPDEAWGHHIDSNRNNCTPDNCYIVKYKYHRLFKENHTQVTQEDFQGVLK